MPESGARGTNRVWFGNSAWPSGRSPGEFAKDVFRIERCETDRDKALVFADWLLRCMNRGGGKANILQLPALGGYINCNDPSLIFTSWGHFECTGWGWIATEALQAAGMKARRSVVCNSGHTYYEVWYKGKDGQEGWHAFDPFLGWYYLNDAGEVASCEELAAHPDLVTHPRPGGRARLGHHPELSGAMYYGLHTSDNLDIVQPVRGVELNYEPKIGMNFTNLWRPEHPDLAIRLREMSEGAHCDITLYDEFGKPRYPEHQPYWKNYVWPTQVDAASHNGGQPVRWHGCGALRWQPLLYGQSAACEVHNAIFEDGTVRPSAAKTHCEVWWHIKLPYLASYLRLNVAAEADGGDLIGFAVSPDAGRSLHSIYWNKGVPPKIITLNTNDTPSIKNMREFWLRLDLSTQSSLSPLRVRGLQLCVGYQHNMHIQPRLLPGQNELFLEAGSVDGVKLQAEWAFTSGSDERVEAVELTNAGRAAKKIAINVGRPDEIVMRGVTLKCLPAR